MASVPIHRDVILGLSREEGEARTAYLLAHPEAVPRWPRIKHLPAEVDWDALVAAAVAYNAGEDPCSG